MGCAECRMLLERLVRRFAGAFAEADFFLPKMGNPVWCRLLGGLPMVFAVAVALWPCVRAKVGWLVCRSRALWLRFRLSCFAAAFRLAVLLRKSVSAAGARFEAEALLRLVFAFGAADVTVIDFAARRCCRVRLLFWHYSSHRRRRPPLLIPDPVLDSLLVPIDFPSSFLCTASCFALRTDGPTRSTR